MEVIKSHYNPEDGVSVVVIREGEDTAIGIVRLHPDDIDIASSFAGCQFAEIKATIKIYKKKWQRIKRELDILKQLYSDIEMLKHYNIEQETQALSYFRKRIALLDEKADKAYIKYITLKQEYPHIVDKRIQVTRDIMKKKLAENVNLSQEIDSNTNL
ncbi:MAG: hypothetical protein RBR68_15505 [Tenuifilaceae bacterium]|nr:hypothetical protein [Tenuifilaceae bacterium]